MLFARTSTPGVNRPDGRRSGCGTLWARWTRASPIWRATTAATCWSRSAVAGELLLDTGGLVSILDRGQPEHAACLKVFEKWSRPVLTTEAVITEATHLLGDLTGGVSAVLRLVLDGGAVLVPGSEEALRRADDLVRRYADLPLDYADATLVVLAEEVKSEHILTLDRKDFSTLRWGRNRAFRIHPS